MPDNHISVAPVPLTLWEQPALRRLDAVQAEVTPAAAVDGGIFS